MVIYYYWCSKWPPSALTYACNRFRNAGMVLVQRARFSPNELVTVGIQCGVKGRLHFVAEKAKINADYYVTNLLSSSRTVRTWRKTTSFSSNTARQLILHV